MPDKIVYNYHQGVLALKGELKEEALNKFMIFVIKVLAESDV